MLVLRCAVLAVFAVLLGAASAHAQDRVVRGASASRGAFTVPGHTVAVFVGDRGRHR